MTFDNVGALLSDANYWNPLFRAFRTSLSENPRASKIYKFNFYSVFEFAGRNTRASCASQSRFASTVILIFNETTVYDYEFLPSIDYLLV
jgi:hypothetical protein